LTATVLVNGEFSMTFPSVALAASALVLWTFGPGAAPASAQATAASLGVSGAVAKTSAAIVLISGIDDAGTVRSAAGFVVEAGGTIVTTLHALQGLTKASVRLANGDSYEIGQVRVFDEAKDLLLVQIPGFALPVVEFGDSDAVAAGDAVTLLTIPLGGGSHAAGSSIDAVQRSEGFRVFQTATPLEAANCGTPVLDGSGRVVAIVTLERHEKDRRVVGIPINYVRGLLATNEKLTLSDLAAPGSPNRSPQQAAGTLPSAAPGERATVVFYRLRRFYGGALERSIYCDDNELATMDNGRYFKVQLPAGPHVCHSTDASAVPLDLRPGETHYVRMEIITGFMKGQGGLVEVTPRQAEAELTRVKPLDKSNVRNSSVIVQ
jgi:S1-C subfamily serine protease